MCGIAGVVRFDGTPVDERLLRTMAAELRHRGPDDKGFWSEGPVGLAHRRLSIIDVAGSPQPMGSADGRWHVVYNGEVFNYRQLRRDVDYPYRTDGDTEVLLALHSAKGDDAVELLQGQFAYAMFDRDNGSLRLVRDRLGVLPLYYYLDATMLAFASEIKALRPALAGGLNVDETSLGDYLAQRSVPAPYTLFRNIRKLPQGHQLRVDTDGRSELSCYWSVPTRAPQAGVSSDGAVDKVAGALERAVDNALVADVPVGAYLSGGVDSSLIVALMAGRHSGEVRTFSAGFDDERVDELPWARQVSGLLGTTHTEVIVRPTDFEDLWHRLTWHRDAPISEPADVAVFRLAATAREHVKVVLSGEGSDELFGGYPKYRYAQWAAHADVVPPALRRSLFSWLQMRLPASAARPRTMLRAMAASDQAERMEAWFAPFTPAERRALLGHENRHGHEASRRATGDLTRRMLYVDCHSWLADNLLERGDRMSMAASLELRPPFLDHRLVELAFSLPSNVKVHKGQTKWVVKEVARRLLPAEIVNRPKVGFRVPLDAWFRHGLREMAGDLLLSRQSFVSQITERKTLTALLDSHQSGRRNEEIRIFTLLCLEVWHQVFFRQPPGSGGDPGTASGGGGPNDGAG